MPRYRRLKVAGGCYFFTVVTEQRRAVLVDESVRVALREAIVDVRRKRPFVIDAWVLLPDHLHTVWTLPPGDADFSTRWRLIKEYVTRACGSVYRFEHPYNARRAHKRQGTLWQNRFWEHLIRDETDFQRHVDYVHANPLKHGLVQRVADWPWSSFHRWQAAGVYPKDWCG